MSKIVGADDPVRPVQTNNMINIASELTQIGKIINRTWHTIPKIYPNIKLGEFIIMPDHIHGIIEICENFHGREGGQSRPPLHKIVQGFKSVTTRKCFKFGYRVIWQRNYYEHIIRNEKEYFEICEYIKNNPINYANKN